MQYRPLGKTDLNVSLICLGTMTYGEQNTREDAFQQLDMALDQGVNFLDTAELYAVPPRAETQGKTEEYLGDYFAATGKRDQWIVATKVTAPSGAGSFPWIRGGDLKLTRANILKSLDLSLKRLKTDYIDLYQLHWPDRNTNNFGQLGYTHSDTEEATPLLETLRALDECVKMGKIRHIGLSNETPWGVMQCVQLAEKHGLARVVSIQNPYSPLNRTFEVGLSEVAMREQVGLLAYSPLGFGVLSGKYLDGHKPANARLTLFSRFQRYLNPRSEQATSAYVTLAKKHGLDPAQMALAFVNQQPFVTSNIIGATTLEQLKMNIDSIHVKLSDEIKQAIEHIHLNNPNPAP